MTAPDASLAASEAAPEPAPEAASEPASETLAAVDLGSNSFRMVIARVVGEEVRPIDRLREGVRLAAYLDADRRLTAEGRRRALASLRKFGQRLRALPPGSVRAVGTNTLRQARKTRKFLARAEAALGHPIEVISGQEEARLIFLGVCHSVPRGAGRTFVLDVGGGSTECIVGEGFEPRLAESLYMGCVGHTLAHFPGGKISRKRMRRAEVAARLELRPLRRGFRAVGWEQAAGSSGTVRAIGRILRLNGWSERGITAEGLGRLRKAVLAADHVDRLALRGVRRERAQVLPGGLAIVAAAFDTFGIERLRLSPGALREGVLYDLLGRIRHEDVRERTIGRFVEQYHVDVAQAERVERTALALLEQVADRWGLDRDRAGRFLRWGARLHEIGLAVAHGGYHKHGAYLLYHSDMPGFSLPDQRTLSLLVHGIRRKLPVALFRDELPRRLARDALRLCILLRLAVLLNRSRSDRPLPPVRLRGKKKLRLVFPAGWLDRHPLTRADLENEAAHLEAAGFGLRVSEAKGARGGFAVD